MPVGAIPIPRAPENSGGSFKPLEPSLYLCEVEAVDKKEGSYGPQVGVTFRVVSDAKTGNAARGKLWENLSILGGDASEEDIKKQAWKWERLVLAFGQTKEGLEKATKEGAITYQPDKWIAKRVCIRTTIYEGKKGAQASIDDIISCAQASVEIGREIK